MIIKRLVRWSLPITIALFLLYMSNVIWGKVSMVLYGYTAPSTYNNVAEFLLLLLACVFFVITTLKAESALQQKPTLE